MSTLTSRSGGFSSGPRRSLRISPNAKSTDMSTAPKRATTVHITSPASRARWMSRSGSFNVASEDELPELHRSGSSASYNRKQRSQQPVLDRKTSASSLKSTVNKVTTVGKPTNTGKPQLVASPAIVDRGDPFVTYNSDSSFSVDSSLADDHSIRSLPTQRLVPSGLPITPSAAALQNPAAAAAALAAANARPRNPQAYRRTSSLSIVKRVRPASVSIMTATPATITEDANSRPRTPEKLDPFQTPYSTPNRPRHVSSPLNISTEELPGTPPSLVRRLSRRLSVSSRDFIISNNNTPSQSQVTLPSFPELPPIPAPSFPNVDQLASLNRRHSVNEVLTPPRLRARSNTAPRAASGARRYVLFPDFMEGDVDNLAERADEDEETAEVEPVVVATETPVPYIPAKEIDPVQTAPPTPLKGKERFQARLSGVRSRLTSMGISGEKGASAEKADGENAKCVVM